MKTFKQFLKESPGTNDIPPSDEAFHDIGELLKNDETSNKKYWKYKKNPLGTVDGHSIFHHTIDLKTGKNIRLNQSYFSGEKKGKRSFIVYGEREGNVFHERQTATDVKNPDRLHAHVAYKHIIKSIPGLNIVGHNHSPGMKKVWKKMLADPELVIETHSDESPPVRISSEKEFEDSYKRKIPIRVRMR